MQDKQTIDELNEVANVLARWDRNDQYSVSAAHADLLAVFSRRFLKEPILAPVPIWTYEQIAAGSLKPR